MAASPTSCSEVDVRPTDRHGVRQRVSGQFSLAVVSSAQRSHELLDWRVIFIGHLNVGLQGLM